MVRTVDELVEEVDRLAHETKFSGVVRVDFEGTIVVERAYGLSHRGHRFPNAADTQFGIASGTKGLTALTVVSLIEEGGLEPGTTARSVLGRDLPLISDDVTVEHLLGHRSGIGDYVDEAAGNDIDEYVLSVPVQTLYSTEQYLPALDGLPHKFLPDERFAYSNSGYVLLALVAERSSGTPFHELVAKRVCAPAGMRDTAFLRSDELPGRAAMGYLANDGLRTNVFHLPVRGSGDGGAYSTAEDLHRLWAALFEYRIVSQEWVHRMVQPRSDVPSESRRYGLGFWLHETQETVMLEGFDAGVSFRSVHEPNGRVSHTVFSNTSDGAWPLTRALDELLKA